MKAPDHPALRGPACHRCKVSMVPHSQEIVDGKAMRVFRCESCNQLQAVAVGETAA